MAIALAIQKWWHHLLGRRFVVRTDQQSLKYLLEHREITLDYQRWLTRILGYEFDIEYKQGSENKVADGLSRIDHSSVANGLSLLALTVPVTLQMQELFREIDDDGEIQGVIAKLNLGESVKMDFHWCMGDCFIDRKWSFLIIRSRYR